MMILFVSIAFLKSSHGWEACGHCGKYPHFNYAFENYTKFLASKIVKRNAMYDYSLDDYMSLSPKSTTEPEYIYRVHIIGHLRRVNDQTSYDNDAPFGPKLSLMAQLTNATSYALAQFVKEGKSFGGMNLDRIDWQRFVTKKSDYSTICLGIAISNNMMVAKRTCLEQITDASQMVFVNEYPRTDGQKHTEHIIESVQFIDGAIATKYNYGLIKTQAISLFRATYGYPYIRPLCRTVTAGDMIDARLSWIFPALKADGNLTTLFTVARILSPAEHDECREVNSNNELLCVMLETDLQQCSRQGLKIVDPGYLAFFQNGFRFYLIGIHSHGAQTCLEAKRRVAFFTRTNVENVQRITEMAEWPYRCHQEALGSFEGFKNDQ